MSHLDAGQRAALDQLQAVVHGADEEVAITVLDSVNWDVQRAVDLIFDSTPPMQRFDIDESGVRAAPRAPSLYQQMARPIYAFFSVPIHLFSSILRFIFSLLRIPIPNIRFSSLSFYTPRPRRSYGGPDRWLRELEEETGAVSISRASTGTSTALDSSGAGPSTLTSRTRLLDDTKVLPDFTLGSYEDALRTCQRDARIGCIILVSEEHDDVSEFKRSTLTNSEFVHLLHDNNMVVWGGDVHDQEAYSAAEKLQATTYPFVAFLALQPRRSPSSASSSSSTPAPTLTVLSRHSGPSTPVSTAPTSASTLIEHLQSQLLPRVTPFLTRLRASQASLERDRALREAQDAAFQATAAKDRARIEGLMAAERAARAAEAEAERQRVLEEERELEREREKERAKETQDAWRAWFGALYSTLPEPPSGAGGVRLAVRLPTGSRLIRTFSRDETLTHLYAFVASSLASPSPSTTSSLYLPSALPPPHSASSPQLDTLLAPHISSPTSTPTNFWGFLLVSAYPRLELPWTATTKLGSIEVLRGGGQLVVEIVNGDRKPTPTPTEAGEDGDGYDTESDED
ncbi:hypothetical protein H0H87_003090 [Tephrocybe sp. NHM501043]|nr:hypothetical protein H0H87_003090 [Tephrocybe sp. NHM501043]